MVGSKKIRGSRNNSRWGRSTRGSKKVKGERQQSGKSSGRNKMSRSENAKRQRVERN